MDWIRFLFLFFTERLVLHGVIYLFSICFASWLKILRKKIFMREYQFFERLF